MKNLQNTPLWIALIALVLATAFVAAPATAVEPDPSWKAKRIGELEGVAMRRIGDLVEVSVWVNRQKENGIPHRRALRAEQITEWTIVQGDGALHEDPETGRILFEPIGNETLVVQPRVGKVVGEPIVIGMNPVAANLESRWHPGLKDGTLDAGGGGVCGHRNGPRMFDEPVDVRSIVSITVIPISRTERVVRYSHGDYYSFHPEVGTMRINYNPDQTSEVRLTSLSPNGKPFFPAKAEGELYFIIETLRDGYKIANWEPMRIEAKVLEWPPFETPVVNRDGVSFHSMERPDVEMHRIAYQELYMYPSRELDVEVETFEIKDGEMIGEFKLTNRTQHEGSIRWFLLGDVQEPLTPSAGQADLGAEGSFDISYRAKVTDSGLPQFITVGAVSETGARLVGSKRINFRTSDWGAKAVALNTLRLDREETTKLTKLTSDLVSTPTE